MEPIESLLDKYWKGETTLAEEKRIQLYFEEQKTNGLTRDYFEGIARMKEMKYQGETPGFKIKFDRRWYSLAATLIIGLMVGVIALREIPKEDPYLVEDPQKALEITKNAFQMISNNLNQGKKYSNEINKINKSKQILENKEN